MSTNKWVTSKSTQLSTNVWVLSGYGFPIIVIIVSIYTIFNYVTKSMFWRRHSYTIQSHEPNKHEAYWTVVGSLWEW